MARFIEIAVLLIAYSLATGTSHSYDTMTRPYEGEITSVAKYDVSLIMLISRYLIKNCARIPIVTRVYCPQELINRHKLFIFITRGEALRHV